VARAPLSCVRCSDLAEREKELSHAEKQLQLLEGERDFLMQAVMPVRMGVAGMARKLLGGRTTHTVSDAAEAQVVLAKLAVTCGQLVDEIRKAIAMSDPDGHAGVDWPALQAQEVSLPREPERADGVL